MTGNQAVNYYELTRFSPYKYPPGFSFFTTYKRAVKLVSNPIEGMNDSLEKFGDTYTVFSGLSRRIILTRDPVFIEYVLRKNHRNYHKSPMVSFKLGRFLGNGLLTSNGPYWLKQRRLIQPGFHLHKIQALYGILQRTTDDFLMKFPGGDHVEILPLMNQFAFEIVIKSLFDVEVPAESVAELGSFITDIQEFVVRDIRQPHKSWWHVLSGEVARNKRRAHQAREILRTIIHQRKASNAKFSDLLDMLLDARYEDTGEPMTEEQIIDEILILIIAGHETTANALSWTLYLLATHQEELSRLRTATNDLGLHDVVTHARLSAVINESMRLYPPAWVSDRVALEDDEFRDFSYPKGTIIILLFYAVHRDGRIWKDATQFKPERFAHGIPVSRSDPEEDKAKAFYPFGAGPRLCIGNNFALAEMAVFLHSFIHRFKIEPTDKVPKMKPQVTLRPEGIFLKVSRAVERKAAPDN